jgi:hypothetical protein
MLNANAALHEENLRATDSICQVAKVLQSGEHCSLYGDSNSNIDYDSKFSIPKCNGTSHLYIKNSPTQIRRIKKGNCQLKKKK